MGHQFFDRSLASHGGHLRMGANFEKRRPYISRSDKYCSRGGNLADFKRGYNFSFGATHQFDSRDSVIVERSQGLQVDYWEVDPREPPWEPSDCHTWGDNHAALMLCLSESKVSANSLIGG